VRRPFDNNQVEVITAKSPDTLTTSVKHLVQQAGDNEKILRRYQQFELALLNVENFQSLLSTLLEGSLKHFQWDAVELWLYDPQSTLQEFIPDHESIKGLRLLSNNHSLKALYSETSEVRLVSVNAEESMPVFYQQPMGSAALLPLIRQGTLVGSLHFGAHAKQRFAGDKSTDFIEHLASIVAVCFENAVNRERLHRLSMFDALTQVKNRRAFQLALDSELSRSSRNGDPISVLFVDLDHFKTVNDQYGHPVGDRVLKTVAQHIHHMLRKTDHVCRYGGEEFALVLPSCGRERALEVAERIRQQVSELSVDDDQDGRLSVTLSVGVSGWLPMPGDNEARIGETLLKCSDQAVYQAKSAGRNCVRYVTLDQLSK
jgi:diguanylate cyclase (GGDEF)-like protein